MVGASNKRTFLTSNYDLSGTLTSGQAFRWRFQEEAWVGIVGPALGAFARGCVFDCG